MNFLIEKAGTAKKLKLAPAPKVISRAGTLC